MQLGVYLRRTLLPQEHRDLCVSIVDTTAEDVSSEMLEYVCQEQNVRKQVMLVILLQIFDAVEIPNLVGAVIVFVGERFVIESVVKCV